MVLGVHPSFTLALVASRNKDPTSVSGVHLYDAATGGGVIALLVHSPSFPSQFDTEFGGGRPDEIANAILHTCRDHEIFRMILLQHQPLHFNVVSGVPAVAQGIQISKIQTVLQIKADAKQSACNFAYDEGLTANRAFMIEQNATAGADAIRLAIVYGDSICIQLGNRIWTTGIKRSGFLLRNFLHQTVKL